MAGALEQFSLEGLLIATFMSGFFMLAMGLLKWGTYIKYIPYSVKVGFTAGIAAIILIIQIKDLIGLTLLQEPLGAFEKVQALYNALASCNWAALAISFLTLLITLTLPRYYPK